MKPDPSPGSKGGPITSTSASRRSLLVSALLLMMIVTVIVYSRADLERIGVDDFIEYWSAGRLNLGGDNPYSQTRLLALQREIGWVGEFPVVMWNPPYTLALVMPFALLPYLVARVLWLSVSIAVVLIASDRLWRLFGGTPEKRGLAPLLAAAFVPTLLALKMGQITGLVLLGVTGFLLLAHRERWMVAGAVLALAAIKPHVVYLVWAAVGLWWLRKPRWRLAGGLILVLGIAWLIPTLVNPKVTSQYAEAVLSRPPLYWRTMTWGTILRLAFGVERQWLQSVAPILGLCWLVCWWYKRRTEWNWTNEMPRLLLVSASTMAFGWAFDLVVLVPVVLQMGVWLSEEVDRRLRGTVLIAYIALQLIALALNIALLDAVYYIWFSPALLVLYLYYSARRTHFSSMAGSLERRSPGLSS